MRDPSERPTPSHASLARPVSLRLARPDTGCSAGARYPPRTHACSADTCVLRSQAARARPGDRRRHRAPGTTLAGTFLVCATLTGAHARQHLAHRHLALGRLALGRLARSPAPRSSAPRSSAPRSSPRHLARRCLVPNHSGRPWARQPGQLRHMGKQRVCHMAVCGPGDHGSHACLGARTARQDPGSRAEDPVAMCYSCCIFGIPVTIPSPNVRNSRNSSSYSSYS